MHAASGSLTAARLTPVGRGAVATIRVCADSSNSNLVGIDRPTDRPRFAALNSLFVAANGVPLCHLTLHKIAFGQWGRTDGEDLVVREDLVVCWLAENVLEIHCHGGEAAVQRVLKDLSNSGCAIVDWREQSALTGDVLEMECLDVLSRTTTWRTTKIVLEQANGLLRDAFSRLNAENEENPLTLALSPQGRGEGTRRSQRANDFPILNPSPDAHENPLTLALSPQSRGEGTRRSQRANDFPILNPSPDAHENPLTLALSLQGRGEGTRRSQRASDVAIGNPSLSHVEILRWAEFGLHLSTPWCVVLTGRPNVGKSSLINALLGYQRAIVFDEPGTTRDVVTGETAFDGWPVVLADTAGIRDNARGLEAAGIALARERLQTADLRLVLVDLSRPPAADDEALLAEWPDALVVGHKSDLPNRWGDHLPTHAVRVSSVSGDGLAELQERIVGRLVPSVPSPGTPIPITRRQIEWLRQLVLQHATDIKTRGEQECGVGDPG